MAGQLCSGNIKSAAKNGKVKNSKAYCEGRASNKSGGGLITDNPHADGSDAHESWRLGFVSWADNPVLGGQDCCADAYGGGFE